ncbi:MAG: helix-turn-helix domain-containing protein [Ruminococcus sp.]|nr:helix-turn-helix domain-containing protein [Ruminococcus sp.]
MKTRDAVIKRILELCEEKYITINGLATSAGIPPSTVKSIIYGVSKNPGVVTIKMICDAFGITLAEFFNTDLFNDLEQEIE